MRKERGGGWGRAEYSLESNKWRYILALLLFHQAIMSGVPLKNDTFYYDFMLFFLQILCFFMPKALYIMLILCHFRIKLCQF